MSNLSDFLNEHGLTPEQVSERSKALEQMNEADRKKKVARETARREKKSYDEVGAEKPGGLGRGVSTRTVKDAAQGKKLTRTNRKKVVRAVNSLLQSQKKEPVEWRALFADVGAQKGKSK